MLRGLAVSLTMALAACAPARMPVLGPPPPAQAPDEGRVVVLPVRDLPEPPPALEAYQRLARETVSGVRAKEMVQAMDPSYRVPGNQAFNDAIGLVVEALEESGYREEGSEGAGTLSYRVEGKQMPRPTWEPVSASLTLEGSDRPLIDLASNINLVAAYSFSTPPEGVVAELVDVGSGTQQDFEGKDVEGKIVMGDASARQLFMLAVQERGALGVLAYRISAYNRPEVNRNVSPMSSIPYEPAEESWGLLLSHSARNTLREAVSAGPVSVRVEVDARIYESEELTLVAEVRGSARPEERFVFSAHVQESGANDNASGVAAQSELARAFAEGVRSGVFKPGRTITMLWGDEISSTRAYMEEDPARAEKVLWGLSLDMVGEDTDKTGGTFLIEKMPDPSAVWTRGQDQHTEWGGRPLPADQLTPHYLNDITLRRCLDQAEATGWVVRTNPFEGGSDHVPFLRAGAPAVLFWHFTDQHYHTSGDRADMVSAATLWNVGVCSAMSAMVLTSADAAMATYLIHELEKAAMDRLKAELEQGKIALMAGADVDEQRLILRTWTDWYLAALDATRDIEVGGSSPETLRALEEAKARLDRAGAVVIEGLW